MLELGIGADIVRAVGLIYWLVFLGCVGLALWLGASWRRKVVYALLVVLLFIAPAVPSLYRTFEYRQKYAKAKALFDERCRSAGEKVYKSVDNVKEILLVEPRPNRAQADRADRSWPGAGFPGESGGNQYIMEFVYFNKPPHGNSAAELTWDHEGTHGYRYVNVDENEGRFRYSLRDQATYTLVGASDPVERYGTRERTSERAPLYAISYENIGDPEGRALWIAGGRIKVIDQRTNEVLGEFIRYALEPGFGDTRGGRSPWAFATYCPSSSGGGSSGHIRSFVERVLKPQQGE